MTNEEVSAVGRNLFLFATEASSPKGLNAEGSKKKASSPFLTIFEQVMTFKADNTLFERPLTVNFPHRITSYLPSCPICQESRHSGDQRV
jgi:hypothetical protein